MKKIADLLNAIREHALAHPLWPWRPLAPAEVNIIDRAKSVQDNILVRVEDEHGDELHLEEMLAHRKAGRSVSIHVCLKPQVKEVELDTEGASFLMRVGQYGNDNVNEWMLIEASDMAIINQKGLHPYLELRWENDKREPAAPAKRHAVAVRWTPEWRATMEKAVGLKPGASRPFAATQREQEKEARQEAQAAQKASDRVARREAAAAQRERDKAAVREAKAAQRERDKMARHAA